jgi:hypothetical protein
MYETRTFKCTIVGKRNKRETFPWIPKEKENEVII